MLSLTTTIRNLVFATLAILLSLSPGVGFAVEKGDILVRLRAIGVIPTGDGDGIAPDLPTSGLEAQPAAVPELDITYMAIKNIGIELILATSPHDIDLTGANAAIGTGAETWLLPPTLLLQYHFDTGTKFRPYIGAGVNYTIVYAENATRSLEDVLGPTSVKADDSFGWGPSNSASITKSTTNGS